jgi:hypothetical protein
MMADTSEELLDMAGKIGVQRKWLQDEGSYREHFDIAQSKRVLAIQNGAIVVDGYKLGKLLRRWREEQELNEFGRS